MSCVSLSGSSLGRYSTSNDSGSNYIGSYSCLYILGCAFLNLSSSLLGGAISVSATTFNVSIYSSFFSDCHATSTTESYGCGGAIFNSMQSGSLLISRVCAYICSAYYYGQFIQSNLASGSNDAQLNFTSILKSPEDSSSLSSSQSAVVYFTYGNQFVDGANASTCKVNLWRTFIGMWFNSNGEGLRYSTLVNLAGSGCVWIRGGCTTNVTECNFNNISDSTKRYGCITLEDSGTTSFIRSCVFLLISTNITGFYANSSGKTITFVGCTFDTSDYDSTNGNNCTFTSSPNTILLHHINSYGICLAYFTPTKTTTYAFTTFLASNVQKAKFLMIATFQTTLI